jgi:hypothetical protein
MVLSVPGDLSALVFRSQSEIDHLHQSRERYELPDLVTVVERLCNASGRLKTMSDARVFVETVLVDLALLERQTDIRSVIARLDGSPNAQGGSTRESRSPVTKPGSTGSSASESRRAAAVGSASLLATTNIVPPTASATPAQDTDDSDASPAAPTDGPLDLAKIQSLWDGFVTFVRQKKVSLGVCLISGKPYAYDGKRLLVRFMKSFTLQREQASRPESLEFLRAMFERYFGHPAEIVCFSEGEEKAVALEEAMQKKPPEERFRDIPDYTTPVMLGFLMYFDGEMVR